MKTVIVIIIAIVALGLFIMSNHLREEAIDKWAKYRGLTVVSTSRHYTAIGSPFYYAPHDGCIYEVHLSNGETWWMRPSIFSNEWVKG